MKTLLFSILLLLSSFHLFAQEDLSLRYIGKAPTSLVGDGKYLVKTTPDRFLSVRGLKLEGQLRFYKGGGEILPASTLWNSTFFPGGVTYDIRVFRDSLHVSYGVLPETGLTILVTCPSNIRLELESKGAFTFHRTEYINDGVSFIAFTQKEGGIPVSNSFEFQKILEKYYTKDLVLRSPNKTLDKTVAFSQHLLDLGYNGEIMLCELFRWLDIWARDLGSGQLPGGLISGRAAEARQSLDYDLRRYALMSPADCKNSNDPSQGGTAAEVGWTARSSWNYYLYSGDLNTLRKDAKILRPWVAHWITRDYDDDGLITDVTEFMDHMLMMLTTNGISSLATNTMYASMLKYFAEIENALGNKREARNLTKLYTRTVDAVNTVYWNQEKEYFENMTLWGMKDERSSQTAQSMLLKIGATDDVRTRKALDYLKRTNWCDYGSVTVTPRMNHVGMNNDQNVKVWPWWNLWETEARFRSGDKEGGYTLLSLAAQTIEDEKYPGLIEETLDIDGTSIGGNVFVTAAGNILEVIVKDLIGVECLKAGWKEIKVVPAVPADWDSYECRIPTPNGNIEVVCKNYKLTVKVNDKRIKVVHVSDVKSVKVTGAAKKRYIAPKRPERKYSPVEKTIALPVAQGKTALFYDKQLHASKLDLDMETVDVEALGNLQVSKFNKLVVPGNMLPLYTQSGVSIKKVLDKYTVEGGTVFFYGATVNPKSDEDGAGILGEQCGIVDWYQYLPARDKQYLPKWDFTPSRSYSSRGNKNGEYTSAFNLNSAWQGKDIYIELGSLVGMDSVFINNRYVGGFRDMEQFIKQEYPTKTNYPDSHRYKMLSRIYILKANDPVYQTLKFGNNNSLKVKLWADNMGYGIPEKNKPNIGVLTEQSAWQATDDAIPNVGFNNPKRKGVNYWGNEQFFNSWSTKNGLFGFEIEGQGIDFCDDAALADMSSINIPVNTAYTDFAVFKPWNFEVLAYTTTKTRLLYPSDTERYPCVVRIANGKSSGGYVLITPAVTGNESGKEILRKLNVKL
ncbi:MAG: hypothetical protein ACK5M3_10295 [Dysgonomonas sp.]